MKKLPTDWNLKLLFVDEKEESIKESLQTTQAATEAFAEKWQSRQDYLEDPDVLLEALEDYSQYHSKHADAGAAGYYWWLRQQIDQSDPKVKAEYGKVNETMVSQANKVQFFELSLGKIARDQQEKFLHHKSLSKYHYFLKKIFKEAKYHLSVDKEEVINLKSNTSYELWVNMVSEMLASETRIITGPDGKKKQANFEDILSTMASSDKTIRDEAARAFHDINAKYADIATHELNAVLANKKVDDELRKLDRPDKLRHIADDISTETVDKLVKTVSAHNHIPERYYKLKAKLLGLPKLEYHERSVEYGTVDISYSYDKAVELVGSVFNNLDSDFQDIFNNFLNEGKIDVYPKPGKRGGAFCVHWGKSYPCYVCLNFSGTLHDVTALAHEVGHGIHAEVMRVQDPLYYDESTATAEVASQYLEDFVLDVLRKDADEEQELAIMIARLEEDIGASFRQVACYKFEQELHERYRSSGYISKEEIGKLFNKHMAAYMGSGVEQSPGSENWWVYWSHIRSFFYVYSYASGLLIAKYMQQKTREDKSFVKKVKEFLSYGTSASTEDIFSNIGIDITSEDFWQTGLAKIESQINEAEKLAKKLGKL